jgi:hypothetical protein
MKDAPKDDDFVFVEVTKTFRQPDVPTPHLVPDLPPKRT